MKNKKVICQDTEIEIKDTSTIEKMRMRDTDGDGICDYIDSNGYTKPQDKFLKISPTDYNKLCNYNNKYSDKCRLDSSGNYILRYSPSEKNQIDEIIKPVLRHSITK